MRFHHAHHGGNRFLHEGDTADAGHIRGLSGRVALHLIKRGRHGDHGSGFRILADFLREVAEKRPQNLSRALFRRHVFAKRLDMNRG